MRLGRPEDRQRGLRLHAPRSCAGRTGLESGHGSRAERVASYVPFSFVFLFRLSADASARPTRLGGWLPLWAARLEVALVATLSGVSLAGGVVGGALPQGRARRRSDVADSTGALPRPRSRASLCSSARHHSLTGLPVQLDHSSLPLATTNGNTGEKPCLVPRERHVKLPRHHPRDFGTAAAATAPRTSNSMQRPGKPGCDICVPKGHHPTAVPSPRLPA